MKLSCPWRVNKWEGSCMFTGLNSVADTEGLYTLCCFALLYTAEIQRSPYIFEACSHGAAALGDLKSVFGARLLAAQHWANLPTSALARVWRYSETHLRKPGLWGVSRPQHLGMHERQTQRRQLWEGPHFSLARPLASALWRCLC